MMQARSNDIRNLVQYRDTGCLLHFTQVCNLESIIEHGFLPRSMIKGRADITAYVIDEERRDEEDDAISVSIST
jgi:hypothetical protein